MLDTCMVYVAIICLVQDEAHNLDSDCRDAASIVLDPAKVELTLTQLDDFKRELQGGVRNRKRAANNGKFQKGDKTRRSLGLALLD